MNRPEPRTAGIRPGDLPRRTRVEQFASDGECLVYSAVRNEASALNRTATEVWRLCDGTLTADGITRTLAQRYRVNDAVLLDDVLQVLDDFRTRGLIDLLDGQSDEAS